MEPFAILRTGFNPLRMRLALTAAATLVLALLLSQSAGFSSLRARVFDALSSVRIGALADRRPLVVDIDRATLAKVGPWPWSRDKLATLVDRIAAAGPKAVAIDILLDGPDQSSPAALARALAGFGGDTAELRALSEKLPDGDKLLAVAIGRTSTVLGAIVDSSPMPHNLDLRPLLVQGTFDARGIWTAGGLVAPDGRLVAEASGLGTLALVGDDDGSVRHVPLITAVQGRLVPSLMLELLRVASGQPFLVLDGSARALRVGDRTLPLGRDAILRLVPHSAISGRAPASRISAASVLDGDAAQLSALRNAVVVIGGSAPELGGLRPQADGSLVAGVELQADAYAQLAAGIVPRRPAGVRYAELIALVLACGIGALLAQAMSPIRGSAIVGANAIVWIGLTIAAAGLSRILLDPITVPLAGAVSFAVASQWVASEARNRAARIRERFEQHLAPAVVTRIADNPDTLKLAGEMRQITTMFTDIEGFTTMTERAEPRRLIEVLDGYFDGISEIVLAHDGLVDKIVGDATHALFNAPFEVSGHAERALQCAVAIDRFARDYRLRPEAIGIGLGRTRIGFESGQAIVGDVGGRRKLDYTAHGSAVNMAARLEQANKLVGTTILIGPGAAALIGADHLMPLGELPIRGMQADQPVFTLWPEKFDGRRRQAWLAIVAAARIDPGRARGMLAGLAAELPDDPILRRMKDRMHSRPA